MPRSVINYITDQILLYEDLKRDALSRKDIESYKTYSEFVDELNGKLRIPKDISVVA